MTDERHVRDLLQAADRSAPRPGVRPVSLSTLQRRLLHRRLRAGACVLVVLACAPWLLVSAHTRAAAGTGSAVGVEAVRAEITRLLEDVTEMRHAEIEPSNGVRLALERSAMASYAYGETLRRRGDPAAAEQFGRVARIWPGTAGGRLAGQRLETRERNER